MRRKVGVVLTAIFLAAALGMLGPIRVSQREPTLTTAVEASVTLSPFELQMNADKNVPTETHGEPF
jgi:hypothetical protein